MVGWTMPDAAMPQRSPLVSRMRFACLAKGLGEGGKNGPHE